MSILDKWKELNIESITFDYDAGGDSISSMTWNVINTNGESIEISNELEQAIEYEAYSECEIYGDSNEDYIGAYGTIIVTYNSEEDCLEYSNDGKEYYNDSELAEVRIELTIDAVQFIQDKVKQIHYPYEFNMAIEYIKDCYLTEKDLEIIKSIETAIEEVMDNYKVEGYNVTETNSIDFSTNKQVLSQEDADETDLTIVGNILYGYVNAQFEYSY